MDNSIFSNAIIKWYDNNPQNYPWRSNNDPYAIWISEVMLQQTQVTTVIPYYLNWLKILPNINTVANAEPEFILKQWEGLGYYARARNFFSACKIISNSYNNKIPNKYDQLISLPGVGPYIAGALLSIAFNQAMPAIDSNVIRVISRLYAKNESLKSINKIISQHINHNRPGDFNQALMDLGRLICKPISPKCAICPLNKLCIAYLNNSIKNFPIKKTKQPKPHYNVAVGIIKKDDFILISKRYDNGLLGGLWEFPGGKKLPHESSKDCIKREIMEELGVNVAPTTFIKQIKHEYSHFKITLDAYFCNYINGQPKTLGCQDFKWIKYNNIAQLPFPKANHKLFNEIKKQW